MRIFLFWFLMLFCHFVHAQLSAKIEELKSNVVYISASPKDKSASPEDAFGFIVGSIGNKVYIATANHTFADFGIDASDLVIAVQFYRFSSPYTALIQNAWGNEDLALLMVNLDVPLKWKTDIADFNPGIGQAVSSIGFDRKWDSPMNGRINGIRISNFNLIIAKEKGSLNRGNSGGPIINEKGIVGMILRTEGTGDLSDALSLSRIRDLFSEYNNVFQLKPDTEGMVYVQGGTFEMGDKQANADARDVHDVHVNTFYLMPTELSFEEFEAYCRTAPKKNVYPNDKGWGKANRPVMNVSWLDAIEYCNWRSRETGKQEVYSISKDGEVTADFRKNGYRLPTEAEWEYAARGGIFKTKSLYASGKNDLSNSGINYEKLGKKQTWFISDGDTNELGLKNMSGNVAEWCWDYYDVSFYRESGNNNPTGPENRSDHVARGGAWNDKEYALRVYARRGLRSNIPYPGVGFRLARNAE